MVMKLVMGTSFCLILSVTLSLINEQACRFVVVNFVFTSMITNSKDEVAVLILLSQNEKTNKIVEKIILYKGNDIAK